MKDCNLNKSNFNELSRIGDAFFIEKIAIYDYSSNKTYLYECSLPMLPFYHWDYIYDGWQVLLWFGE